MDSVTFLGTGGGRFVLLTQRRFSGGLWLELDGVRFILDPGPGALVRALQFGKDPGRLDCVLASHKHLDHYNDVEVMVEAMTHGLNRRKGLLAVHEGVVEYISDYHWNSVETIVVSEGGSFEVGDVHVDAIPTVNHVGGVGFRFACSRGVVTYSGDTGYDKRVVRHYGGSRVLVLNTIFASGTRSPTHLNTDDAVEIASQAKPELLIINHFGVRMLREGPEKEAERITEEAGVRVVASADGMTVDLEDLSIMGQGGI
ncbi:MAG: MBL fold metallo-hydrolase [Candidatus Altiarchaeales archaeon]|nr:MBL fold metallo-hydrolase [Candidatus Altiarchaeales archaeon]MBD3415727.1 MBL fold metallo-hydrolase [Candidatus Altiarchaeales archaeon]